MSEPANVPTAASSALKFYHAENCNRRFRVAGKEFIFPAYDLVAGCWMGTYATADAEEQAALDILVRDKTTAVTEISQERYESHAKKKPTVQPVSFKISNAPPSLTNMDARIADSRPLAHLVGGQDPDYQAPPAPPSSEPLPDVETALVLGLVQTPG